MSPWTKEDEKHFEESREILTRFRASLPKRVEASKTSIKAKLPFFVSCLRECLLYRVTELGESTCNMAKTGQLVAGALLARALMEAVALLIVLDQRVRESVDSKKVEVLDALVSKSLVGCRNKATPLEAINVLTILDHASKKYDGLRTVYDDLSEIAHPNWGGLLGAYATLNKEERLYELNMSRVPLTMVLLALNLSLQVFDHTYNPMNPFLVQLVGVCDDALPKENQDQ